MNCVGAHPSPPSRGKAPGLPLAHPCTRAHLAFTPMCRDPADPIAFGPKVGILRPAPMRCHPCRRPQRHHSAAAGAGDEVFFGKRSRGGSPWKALDPPKIGAFPSVRYDATPQCARGRRRRLRRRGRATHPYIIWRRHRRRAHATWAKVFAGMALQDGRGSATPLQKLVCHALGGRDTVHRCAARGRGGRNVEFPVVAGDRTRGPTHASTRLAVDT